MEVMKSALETRENRAVAKIRRKSFVLSGPALSLPIMIRRYFPLKEGEKKKGRKRRRLMSGWT